MAVDHIVTILALIAIAALFFNAYREMRSSHQSDDK